MSTPEHTPADDRAPERETSSDAEALPALEESRIIIRSDGQVVIENLSALLTEVAGELDPEAELACRLELAPTAVDTDTTEDS